MLIPGAIDAAKLVSNGDEDDEAKSELKFIVGLSKDGTFVFDTHIVKESFLKWLFTPRGLRMLRRSILESNDKSDGWKTIRYPHFYNYFVSNLVFRRVRPRACPEGGIELEAGEHIVVFDECDKFFEKAECEDGSQCFPPSIAKEVEEQCASLNPEWLKLPVGNSNSRGKYTYAAPRTEMRYQQGPSEYTCLKTSFCSALACVENKYSKLADGLFQTFPSTGDGIYQYEEKCRVHIEAFLKVSAVKLKDVEVLEDVLKQMKPNGGVYVNPVWMKLLSDQCIHVVTVYNNMIFESSEPIALEATQATWM